MCALNNRNILILGYGGAAKTIVGYLMSTFQNKIFVYGRSPEKISSFIDNMNYSSEKETLQKYDNRSQEINVIINCIPTNVNRNSINSTLNFLNYIPISKESVFIDLNYVESNFSREMKSHKREFNFISGIDMLIFQALKSFEIWFGKSNKFNHKDIKSFLMEK